MAASQGEHCKIVPGMLVHNRYQIVKEVGSGNFSKVYQCIDNTKPERGPLALKVLKKEYANDAAFENDMLKVLTNKDAANSAKVSKMHDFFTWNRYPCFVMPLRGPSLRSRKVGIGKGHVTREQVLRLAKSLLESLKYIHFDCKIVHTDLKPENILLDEDSESLGNGWTICDFGSASHWRPDRMDSDLISTRPYRAPEVVLGNPWSFPADMWSIGCILFEAANGTRLFEVHDDLTHLHYMEARLGKIPELFSKHSKHSKKHFDGHGNFIRPTSGNRNTTLPRPLTDALKEDPLLHDLLRSMLHYDPTKRIRADDALNHPVFTELLSKPSSSTSTATEEGRRADAKGTSPPLPKKEDVMKKSPDPQQLKFRALPPLSALANLKLQDKENCTATPPGGLRKCAPPLPTACRTPEEIRRAAQRAIAVVAPRVAAETKAAGKPSRPTYTISR